MHTEQTRKQIIKSFFLIIFAALTLTSFSACQPQKILQQRFLQFGTIIDITLVTTDEDRAYRLFNDIELLLKKRHLEWHGWQDGTLKQFNQALLDQAAQNHTVPNPAKGIRIPETLQSLVHDSKKYYALSKGLFNPAMGKLIDAWGFHQQSIPNLPLINKIKQDIPGMHDLIIKNNHAITLNPYLQLDFGAIAKGLAVEQIVRLLDQNHIKDYIINAGGDIFAQGKKQTQNWRIAIENPFSDGIIGKLEITEPASVFTSGNYRRFYLDENNTKRHHIINPLTGEPSANISSVTVLHKNPVVADVAATTLMLTDISELKEMAEKLDVRDYLAITEQHELYISPSMSEKIQWIEPQTLKVQPL